MREFLDQAFPGQAQPDPPLYRAAIMRPDAPPREAEELLGWPRVPSWERLEAAWKRQKPAGDTGDRETDSRDPEEQNPEEQNPEDEQGRRDAAALLRIRETLEIEEQALLRIKRRIEAQRQGPECLTPKETVTAIVWEEDTEDTIGALLASTDPTQELMMSYRVSRVLRDPDWMGFCRILPHIRESHATLLESPHSPGRPGLLLSFMNTPEPGETPDGWDEDGTSLEDFPPGEARMLRELALWHGATSCRWSAAQG